MSISFGVSRTPTVTLDTIRVIASGDDKLLPFSFGGYLKQAAASGDEKCVTDLLRKIEKEGVTPDDIRAAFKKAAATKFGYVSALGINSAITADLLAETLCSVASEENDPNVDDVKILFKARGREIGCLKRMAARCIRAS